MNIQSFSLVCRACLSSNELKPLFGSRLHIIYEKITELKITFDDKLPQSLCTTCFNKLEDISKFIETCRVNDNYLKTILVDVDTNIKDEDSSHEIEHVYVSEDFNNVLPKKNEEEVLPNIPSNSSNQNCNKNIKESQVKKKHYCETCDKSFSSDEKLKRHKAIHSGIKLFECKSCDKKFSQKSILWRHLLIHTDDKPFECNLCGKTSRRKSQIQDHLQKHHSNVSPKEYNTVITEREVTMYEQENFTKTIPCADPKIEIEFNDFELTDNMEDNVSEPEISEESQLAEIKTEHPVKTELKVEETNSEVDEMPPIKKKRIELCLCSLCGKQFKRREYLRNHMGIHMNIKPFTCNVCGAGFTQRQAHARHQLVHTKERPHKCTYCDKTFIRKEKLTDHVRCHEEGVPPHLCFHCGKRFKDREYLRKHLQYFLKGGKNRWKPESKRCLCQECGKEFHSQAYLKRHMNSHAGVKPYSCEICNKSFSVNAGLEYHMKIHKGVKPFKCSHLECNKAFRSNYAKTVHEKMHGTERPYICDICNKGFVRNGHLKRHKKLHGENSESVSVNT